MPGNLQQLEANLSVDAATGLLGGFVQAPRRAVELAQLNHQADVAKPRLAQFVGKQHPRLRRPGVVR